MASLKSMAKIFAGRCEKRGFNFYDSVPEELQAAAAKIIEEDGYTILEDGSVIEREEDSDDDSDA